MPAWYNSILWQVNFTLISWGTEFHEVPAQWRQQLCAIIRERKARNTRTREEEQSPLRTRDTCTLLCRIQFARRRYWIDLRAIGNIVTAGNWNLYRVEEMESKSRLAIDARVNICDNSTLLCFRSLARSARVNDIRERSLLRANLCCRRGRWRLLKTLPTRY